MGMKFPPLVLEDWRETRDALHAYARVIGSIRRGMTPFAKHWWHITLSVSARGLTTTPIPANGATFELVLNPMQGQLELSTSEGREARIPFHGQSQRALYGAIVASLGELGVRCSVQLEPADTSYEYLPDAAAQFWCALTQIDTIYKEFKGGLREETGPVHIFPHHFDISLNWFSGRLVQGADPSDAEAADEQMNFGFVTGDESIAEAYFYATAYPKPATLTDAPLPDGAYWHTEGFTGAILMYDQLVGANDPRSMLLGFLQKVQQAGSRLMR